LELSNALASLSDDAEAMFSWFFRLMKGLDTRGLEFVPVEEEIEVNDKLPNLPASQPLSWS
jgi:hypothetical protein